MSTNAKTRGVASVSQYITLEVRVQKVHYNTSDEVTNNGITNQSEFSDPLVIIVTIMSKVTSKAAREVVTKAANEAAS